MGKFFQPNVNIIVLNYNGKDLLAECLPSIIEASKHSVHSVKVTVLDNCSEDGSLEWLSNIFSEVVTYRAPSNEVLCSYNELIKKDDVDIVILLNNDIKVERDFVDTLARIFIEEEDVFLVSSKSCHSDGSYEGGRSHAFIKWGIFGSDNSFEEGNPKVNERNITFAAGFGAFDRKKYLELGGYDKLYLPGRLEDADICFRAWRRGYKCIYEPQSVVYHKGAVSFDKKFGISGTLIISFRNTFLFMWKNIRDPWYLVMHIIFFIPRLIFSLIRGKPELFLGFLQAIPLMWKSIKKRREERGQFIRSDREIFNLFQFK